MKEIKSVLLDNSFVIRLLKKDDDSLRKIEERKVIINDLKLFAQIKNREIDAFITKDRKALPKMIEPLRQNRGLHFEYIDLTIPLAERLGILF